MSAMPKDWRANMPTIAARSCGPPCTIACFRIPGSAGARTLNWSSPLRSVATGLATSVGGTLTGRGGNLIIIDDPMKPQDAYSEAARESTKQWYSNTLLSRLDDKTNDAIIVVMQRLHMDDLVGHLLEQEGWTHLNLPAIAESEHRVPARPSTLPSASPRRLLHPEREPRAVLDEFKRSMGSLDFAAQYQQEPVAEGGNLIKWKWFSFYRGATRATSGRQDYRQLGYRDQQQGAFQLFSLRGASSSRGKRPTCSTFSVSVLNTLISSARSLSCIATGATPANSCELVIENKGSGMPLIQDLKREGIHAIAVDPKGDKLMRMNAQTARIEAGSVLFPQPSALARRIPRRDSGLPGQSLQRSDRCVFAGTPSRFQCATQRVQGRHYRS